MLSLLKKMICVDEEIAEEASHIKELRDVTEKFQDHAEIITDVYRATFSSEDVMYIADIDTHELLWANKHTKELFGDDIIGKKCYEALQKKNSPCEFCTNDKLKPGDVYKWVYHNPIIKKTFLIKDRLVYWRSKPARIEQAIEIGDVSGIVI